MEAKTTKGENRVETTRVERRLGEKAFRVKRLVTVLYCECGEQNLPRKYSILFMTERQRYPRSIRAGYSVEKPS